MGGGGHPAQGDRFLGLCSLFPPHATLPTCMPTRCRDTGRLDWMYAGSLAAKEDAAKRQEEALLGQRAATLAPAETADKSRVG